MNDDLPPSSVPARDAPSEVASGTQPPAAIAAAPARPMTGVQIRRSGRVLLGHTGRLVLKRGDRVVIEGEQGTDVATVVLTSAVRPGARAQVRILRVADARDEARAEGQAARAAEALKLARELARARQLPMKFFRVEASPSSGRTLFYFASETRVDFRELVRELAAEVRGRIELRQVGARDEAKMVGGIGSCGQELCCSTFLPKFAPVSIRMAKDQGLALAPSKVSGQCGRLKCCLVYEQAHYVEAAKRLPKLGKRVATPEGLGRVGDLDVLRGRVRVTFEDRPPKVFEADQVTMAQPGPESLEGETPAPPSSRDNAGGERRLRRGRERPGANERGRAPDGVGDRARAQEDASASAAPDQAREHEDRDGHDRDGLDHGQGAHEGPPVDAGSAGSGEHDA
jgi:cell fate regulator YaaT (PSP1 superfamily)